MKKGLNLTLFAILALALPYTVAQAETTAVAGQVTVAAPAKPVVATEATPVAPETISEKKVAAEKNLKAIQAQFSLFATRTQAAIDRLTLKKVDTTKAQAELALTNTSLGLTKTNLDLLAKVTVTDDMTDTTELKAALKTVEDNLKDARTHLINSLTELKAAVATTIDAQVQ